MPPPFEITITGQSGPIEVIPGQPVLESLIDAGHSAIAVGCRGGGCGVCRIQVLSGRYESRPMSRSRISAADEAEHIVLACRIVPQSDIEIAPLPLTPGRDGAIEPAR